jgi:CO/xanthine dehydrogenase Mo-binding subunit
MHWPFLTNLAIAGVLGLEPSKVHLIVSNIGGSFGVKQSVLNGSWACLSALKTKKPSLIVYRRDEDFIITEKRHPYIIKSKIGATSEGKLLAVQNDIISNSGAYSSTSIYVGRRSLVHSGGSYIIPNVHSRLRVVYTNQTPSSSFRGFGGPQVTFVIESQMDELASRLKMDPIELRLKNILKPGSQTITNQVLDSVGLEETIATARENSKWDMKRSEYQKIEGIKKKGIGVATIYHGTSIGVEGHDHGSIRIFLQDDGSVLVRTGIVDFGQGTKTAIAIIVAEILGIPIQSVHVDVTDNRTCLDSGITAGSRGTTMGGNAAVVACYRLRERLDQVASSLLGCNKEEVEMADGRIWMRGNESKIIGHQELVDECKKHSINLQEEAVFESPSQLGKSWDPDTLLGDAYISFAFATYIAEVEVDVETGKYDVSKILAVHDSGKIINPLHAEVNVHGGIVQALGMTMMEEVIHSNGKIVNPNLSDYYIPTSLDCPKKIEINFVECRSKEGPFGAKGLGEVPMDAVLPAVANAVFHATGVRVKDLPITSEKIFFNIKSM